MTIEVIRAPSALPGSYWIGSASWPVRRRWVRRRGRRRAVSKLDPLKVLGGAAVGAAAMYVFDPDRGHRRRVMLRDRSRSVLRHEYRHANRAVRQKVVDTENRIEGAVIRARGGGRFHPESDVDLREHLRQVIATVDFSTKDVNVEAVKGANHRFAPPADSLDGDRS